jgi:alpha-mannosidase
VFASCDTKKYSGGRFAIQGSSLPEFYYLPDLYTELIIKDNVSVVGVKGEGILVSALKKSEKDDSFILRIVNMSDKQQEISINYKGKVIKSDLTENEITELKATDTENNYKAEIKKKEIATFVLK